jgi:hypothetical protein
MAAPMSASARQLLIPSPPSSSAEPAPYTAAPHPLIPSYDRARHSGRIDEAVRR